MVYELYLSASPRFIRSLMLHDMVAHGPRYPLGTPSWRGEPNASSGSDPGAACRCTRLRARANTPGSTCSRGLPMTAGDVRRGGMQAGRSGAIFAFPRRSLSMLKP